jgi:hypothetical protein
MIGERLLFETMDQKLFYRPDDTNGIRSGCAETMAKEPGFVHAKRYHESLSSSICD